MSPQQLVEGNAQLWGRKGRGYSVREARAPTAAPPSPGLRSTPAWPLAPRPAAQGRGGRGRPPLVVCLEGKKGSRGEKPKVGLAEGLPGNSTTLA